MRIYERDFEKSEKCEKTLRKRTASLHWLLEWHDKAVARPRGVFWVSGHPPPEL